jgi:hypothetical protein
MGVRPPTNTPKPMRYEPVAFTQPDIVHLMAAVVGRAGDGELELARQEEHPDAATTIAAGFRIGA